MRTPWLGCTALVAAGLLALGGCGDPAGGPDAGPTVASTATDEPAPSSEPESAGAPAPPRTVAELCAPYADVVAAVEELDGGAASDEVVAELAPVVRRWAKDLAATARPPGMPADAWSGVELLAERILALPQQPTYEQLEAVAAELSAQERQLLVAASSWFVGNCDPEQ